MEVDKSESALLQRAIGEWEQHGLITGEQATKLQESLEQKQTDRQQVAQYFFFIALFCILLAFGAIFINEKLLERIKVYFSLSDLVIGIITAALSVLWFWYIGRKRPNISPAAYEVYMVLGGLSVLTSLIYFCKHLSADTSYTVFLGCALLLLAMLSALFQSKALWIGAICSLIGWFGTFSYAHSADNLFIGMNYPMRYTAFGLAILLVAWLQRFAGKLSFTQRITYTTGLILFFTGLWGVSIFGNFNSLVGWQQVRQIHVLAYSIAFGVAAALCFYLGIRYKDDMAKDFGVIFLLINFYTRYFEYFWDAMNKGLFFLVLAITFGLAGWWLERRKKT